MNFSNNTTFNSTIFTNVTKQICMCTATSILIIVLFIISPLSNFFNTSIFMKIIALIIIIVSIIIISLFPIFSNETKHAIYIILLIVLIVITFLYYTNFKYVNLYEKFAATGPLGNLSIV